MKKLLAVLLITMFFAVGCIPTVSKIPTRTSTTKYTVDPDCR